MREINPLFIADINKGPLKDLYVLCSQGCWLGIRKNYINIYYRGGNALKIGQTSNGYTFSFDAKYCKNINDESNFEYLSKLDRKDLVGWAEAFPVIKMEMDSWFLLHPKPEREFQHRLLESKHNEFEIIDIEYAGWTKEGKLFRLDMLAVYHNRIVIIENKYGQGAIGGKAGLKKHYDDIVSIIDYPESREVLIGSVKSIVRNKKALGLTSILFDYSGEIEILFLMAEYNPKSKAISNEVGRIEKTLPAKILFMTKEEGIIHYETAKDLWEYGV